MYDVKIPKLLQRQLTATHANGSVSTWFVSEYSPRRRLGNEGLHPLLYWVPKK